jgi:TM2 domain-containing membrane protein YozV
MVMRSNLDPARGLGWPTFLAGFVPGLLQFRLGQTGRALLAFVSCTALFFVGWLLVRERLFYWALLTPDSPAPNQGGDSVVRLASRYGGLTLTLPELLNWPANTIGSLFAFDASPMGERAWRLPRPMEHIGGFLTGASGMLAAFWSAAGHWELRRRRDGGLDGPRAVADPALCAALSWLVPGLGQMRAGQRDKGMLMGAAVLIVFALGLWFSEGHAVDRGTYSVWWIGQNLCGGGSLFAALVTAPLEAQQAPLYADLGVVLCTVAGLMNLVVMIDAFTVAERSVFPVQAPEVLA